jgi:metal-responsive CopG/Arc/MetJ family transcriptional regulator
MDEAWLSATDEVLDELVATGVQSRETLVQWLARREVDPDEWLEWAEHQARAIERIVSEGDRAFFAVRPEVAKIRTQGRGA